MRNFQKILQGLNVQPLLHNLQRRPELWNENRLRKDFPDSPHREVDDIWLRFQEAHEGDDLAFPIHKLESVNWPAFRDLPSARPMIFGLMAFVEGERLGRVMITRLAPGKVIYPHIDGGDYASYYGRYHVVLQALPGCATRSGTETVVMGPGEVWWFDNLQEHEVINQSADDRIVMIVDIRTTR
jgi:hypothetical protein